MRLIDADKCPCKGCSSEFNCYDTYCPEFEEWLQKSVYNIDKIVEALEENGKCVGIDSIDCPVKYCWDCEESVISIKKSSRDSKRTIKGEKVNENS